MTRRREIFTGMGIKFNLNTEVAATCSWTISHDTMPSSFASGLISRSTAGSKHENADGVYAALPFLIANTKQLMGFGETRDEPFVSVEGKRVVVLGGGDTRWTA
ncbi:hypothetical protein ACLK1T_15810 [Escherichia coli]